MSNDFVPLLKTADLHSAAALSAASSGPSEAAFRPVLAGPVHCSASAPAPASASEGGATGPTSQAPASPPTVTLKREGDRVTHVQIQCSCGELIELNCVYGL